MKIKTDIGEVDLDVLEKAAYLASKGTWKAGEQYEQTDESYVNLGTYVLAPDQGPNLEDARYIAFAQPAVVLAMIALIEEQAREIRQLERQYCEYC